jgi:hypothetical protein
VRILRAPGLYNHKHETPHFITVQNIAIESYNSHHFLMVESNAGSGKDPICHSLTVHLDRKRFRAGN